MGDNRGRHQIYNKGEYNHTTLSRFIHIIVGNKSLTIKAYFKPSSKCKLQFIISHNADSALTGSWQHEVLISRVRTRKYR